MEDLKKEIFGKTLLVGQRQVVKAMTSNDLEKVIVAEDADVFFLDEILSHAKQCNVRVQIVGTRQLLAQICKISVPTAVFGIVKTNVL